MAYCADFIDLCGEYQPDDETIHLEPLREIAEGGPTQAEEWLSRYHGAWGGDVTRIFRDAAI